MDHQTLAKLACRLSIAAIACLVMSAQAQDTTSAGASTVYTSQAKDAEARLHLQHISQSDRSSLETTVADLNSKATELDLLKPPIDKKTAEVTDAETQSNNATDAAATARQHSNETGQSGKARANQLVQQMNDTCTQMSGKISGQKCLFSCREDQPEVCSQAMSAFENAIAPLKQQIQSIAQEIEDADLQAQAAEADASVKEQTLNQLRSELKALSDDFDPKLAAFRQELQSFNDGLDKAPKTPFAPRLGPTFQQLKNVPLPKNLNERRFNCYDGQCADFSANSDGTLVVPPAPDVPASASAQAQKVGQLQTDLQNLTTQYNDVHDKLRAAEANHDPASAGLIKQLSELQGKMEMKTFEMRTRSIDMTVAPKKQ